MLNSSCSPSRLINYTWLDPKLLVRHGHGSLSRSIAEADTATVRRATVTRRRAPTNASCGVLTGRRIVAFPDESMQCLRHGLIDS